MDKKVTVKFWQLYPGLVDGVDFEVSLDSAFALTGQNLDLTGDPDTGWPKRSAFLKSSLAKAKTHVGDRNN